MLVLGKTNGNDTTGFKCEYAFLTICFDATCQWINCHMSFGYADVFRPAIDDYFE